MRSGAKRTSWRPAAGGRSCGAPRRRQTCKVGEADGVQGSRMHDDGSRGRYDGCLALRSAGTLLPVVHRPVVPTVRAPLRLAPSPLSSFAPQTWHAAPPCPSRPCLEAATAASTTTTTLTCPPTYARGLTGGAEQDERNGGGQLLTPFASLLFHSQATAEDIAQSIREMSMSMREQLNDNFSPPK